MKFYYESSDGQIRDSSGELYHASKKNGWKKDDHKYIKREWKNGKWVYTYPQDTQTRSSVYLKPKNNLRDGSKIADTLTTYKQQRDRANTWTKLAKDSFEKAMRETDRNKQSEGTKKYGKALGIAALDRFNAQQTAHELVKQAKKRSEKNATELYSKADTSKKVSGEYEDEKEYNSRKNEYPAPASTKTETEKPENWLDKAKNWVKDKLGYDEKDAAEAAAKAKTEAEKKAATAQAAYDLVRDMAYGDNKLSEHEQRVIDKYKVDAIVANGNAQNAGYEYVRAQQEWLNSPLNKINTFLADVKEVFKPTDSAERIRELFRQANAKKAEEEAAEEAERDRMLKEDEYEKKERSILKRMKEIAEKYASEHVEAIKKLMHNNPLPGLDIKDEPTTPTDDMEMTNPKYNKDELDLYDENCGLCTLAYDLRRRGYDVVANNELSTIDGEAGMTPSEQMACYDGGQERMDAWWGEYDRTKEAYEQGRFKEAVNEIERTILKYGDGARGTLSVYWIMGGGHSIAWEVEDGKLVIRDAQTGEEKPLGYYANYCNRMAHTRVDDLEPNEEILRYVSERKKEGER